MVLEALQALLTFGVLHVVLVSSSWGVYVMELQKIQKRSTKELGNWAAVLQGDTWKAGMFQSGNEKAERGMTVYRTGKADEAHVQQ